MLTAWLTGLLGGMADPKTYPKLDTLLGEPKREDAPDPGQASANARAWGAWLRAENKRAGAS